ncbi:MAG TPA: HD domain-containing phosphohydrolase [Gemmatimonadaceae bacterium]|nr:HD domain-containing phosphohydrolase [Gemmatimonadaceae bacterium]
MTEATRVTSGSSTKTASYASLVEWGRSSAAARQTDARLLAWGRSARAETLLESARAHDRGGRFVEAVLDYGAAIVAAESAGAQRVLAEALRHLSLVHQRRREADVAMALCRRSHDVAVEIGDEALAAAALNSLAAYDLEAGRLAGAAETFRAALRYTMPPRTRGSIEQNLGILANIQGHLDAALAHYGRSLEAFLSCSDERGCAIAYNNLGMVSADRKLWGDAERHFQNCLEVATKIGDVHLRGLALLNQTEVFLARQRYDEGMASAEAALAIFDQLGALANKSDAYRFLGVVYRDTGRAALAEARLRTAMELAVGAGGVLEEAEASRELARLYQDQNRNQDALKLLNAAHRLFRRLDARRDLVDVTAKVGELEGTYLAIVRGWGQSIETSDSYTHGHCERVSTYAVRLAGALGLDDAEQTTVRLGAYLHDVGKVRVPHEIINKPGRLTNEEFAVMKRHPEYGVELLAGIEFPWDITPMIRSHHERYDGSGYPDRLRGDEIPLTAQIIGIADVYDALTTTRSYRGAMSHDDAVAEIRRCAQHWKPAVLAAFLSVVEQGG